MVFAHAFLLGCLPSLTHHRTSRCCRCTGSSAACPANPFKPSTEQCRSAAGDCDLPAK